MRFAFQLMSPAYFIHSLRNIIPRPDLRMVRVAGKLQINSVLLRFLEMERRVIEQDNGFGSIE